MVPPRDDTVVSWASLLRDHTGVAELTLLAVGHAGVSLDVGVAHCADDDSHPDILIDIGPGVSVGSDSVETSETPVECGGDF